MIAGLDISTKAVHVVSLPEDTNHAQLHVVRLDVTRGSAVDRIRRLRDAMPARTAWADAGCALVALERPFSRSPGIALMMAVYGAVLQLFPADMPLLELSAPKPLHTPHQWEPILSNTASAEIEPIQRAQHCTVCGAYSAMVTLGSCPGAPGVDYSKRPLDLTGIDWVIIGGESGPGARPFHLEHAREIIDRSLHLCKSCARAYYELGLTTIPACTGRPAIFVKQLGASPLATWDHDGHPSSCRQFGIRDRKGGDIAEWPADLQIREFPQTAVAA